MSWMDGLEPRTPAPTGTAPATPRRQPGDDRARRYALRALEAECAIVAQSAPGGRNNTLNVAALKVGQLVAGGGLERGEAIDALTAAAKQCGLADHEVRATLASGMKAGEREPRTAPAELISHHLKLNDPGDPDDSEWKPSDDDAPDAPPRPKNGASGDGDSPDYPVGPTQGDPLRGLHKLGAVAVLGRDAIETLAREPVEFAWDDIAVVATIVLIAGPPSGGKTTLLFLLLAARLSPTPIQLLGRDVQPASSRQYVVLIEGEHSESSAARKLVKSLDLLGVDHDVLARVIIVARKSVRLVSPEWSDVETMVAAGIVSDIAIDTVARVAPADASSEQEQVAIFDAVARTIERAPDERQPTVWAVAHLRKNGKTGDVDDVSGSAQRVGQADSVLLIKPEKVGGRTVSTTVTFAKLREDPDDRWPEPAEFSIVTVDGKRELRKSIGGRAPEDDRPLEARIIDLLKAGPQTKSALSKALGRNKPALEEPITNLFSARAIRTTTVAIYGRSYPAFELTSEKAPYGAPYSRSAVRAPDEPEDCAE